MDIKTNPPSWLKWDEESIKSYDKSQRQLGYIYGIKNVQVKYKEFNHSSVYVSRPFDIDGNVAEISLESQEYNPISSVIGNTINPFDTSVEYYITFNENPTPEDWIPILPKQDSIVKNELLLFRNTPICQLRFLCDTTKEITVYKNGVKLNKQFWSYGSNNTISIDNKFDKYAMYTVQYSPNVNVSSPWDVELTARDRQIVPYVGVDGMEGEVFRNGTDRNGSITLSKHPFVDYGKINSGETYAPISVSLEDANIAGANRTVYNYIDTTTSPVKTINKTDYKTLSDVILMPYDTKIVGTAMANPYFEYYQDGRKLYFTETFNNSHIVSNMETNHGDATLRVKYDYLQAKVRLKIILRSTSNKSNSVTPVVNGYNLIFKVMR